MVKDSFNKQTIFSNNEHINKNRFSILPPPFDNNKKQKLKDTHQKIKNKIDKYRNIYEYVIKAVSNDGMLLEHASNELKNNFNIVITSVNNEPFSLLYASDDLKNNKDIVTFALYKNNNIFEYASDNLKHDKELLELYLNNFDIKDAKNPNFYKECEIKLHIIKEQEWMENNILSNNTILKARKF